MFTENMDKRKTKNNMDQLKEFRMHSLLFKLVFVVGMLWQIGMSPLLAQESERGLSRGAVESSSVSEFDPLKLAVLVGINQYSSLSGVSALNYAVADVKALQASLERQGYNVLALYDGEATVNFIQKAIKKITRLANSEKDKRNATLIFSFSGHGFAVDGQNYLVTYDTDRENVTETGLTLDSVISTLKDTGIAQKVVFLDACRNNPGQKSTSGAFVAQPAEGLGILFSTRSGDVSYESSTLGGGIFSHFLVEGLDGGAADKEGVVSLHSLKRYVERKVPEWTVRNLQVVQTPYQAGEYTGEFKIAYAATQDQEAKPFVVAPVQPDTELTATDSTTIQISNTNNAPANTQLDQGDRLQVYVESVDNLASSFHEQLSSYLLATYATRLNLVDKESEASLVISISTSNLELLRAGRAYKVEGDLLVTGHHKGGADNESNEYVPVKGSSFSSENEAIKMAASNWVKEIGSSSALGTVKKYLKYW